MIFFIDQAHIIRMHNLSLLFNASNVHIFLSFVQLNAYTLHNWVEGKEEKKTTKDSLYDSYMNAVKLVA